MNKTAIRKQNKSKEGKKLQEFEVFSKFGDLTTKNKCTPTSLFGSYENVALPRSKIRSAVEKPLKIRRKSVHTEALDARLVQRQRENLDYTDVFVTETDLEKSTRERLIRKVKQQNWADSERSSHHENALSTPSMLGRKMGVAAPLHGTRLKTGNLIAFAPRVQYCDRLVHVGKDKYSKQFCDVLGPNLCTDCTKSQMQQFVIDEQIRRFPDICVSPYVLCVPQESERDLKTPFSVYKECDPLQRRRPWPASLTHHLQGLKTRPNSCTDEKSRSYDSKYATDYIPSESQNCIPHIPLEIGHRLESPFSSVGSSRRSSITRFLMESKNFEVRTKSENSAEDGKMDVFQISLRGIIPPAFRSPMADYNDGGEGSLEANCFGKRGRISHSSSRLNITRSRSSMCKTPSIERTGKLRELPYWKILIPEPPMMEVGRMNVSIYTPKQIPGIKIFDESFFEI
ncbi:uncharacterized protein LOC111331181 [Stylophora pistillata]|uniref:uncharacterized protein LOC111331181 n=1 Tax=Stylophora pistillata TaxID=50429 RepID=UPI000C049FA2|nr:uncharacterized protein LOC111331181 [Stylophora pistillata]